jgi:hypothetical protein
MGNTSNDNKSEVTEDYSTPPDGDPYKLTKDRQCIKNGIYFRASRRGMRDGRLLEA